MHIAFSPLHWKKDILGRLHLLLSQSSFHCRLLKESSSSLLIILSSNVLEPRKSWYICGLQEHAEHVPIDIVLIYELMELPVFKIPSIKLESEIFFILFNVELDSNRRAEIGIMAEDDQRSKISISLRQVERDINA